MSYTQGFDSIDTLLSFKIRLKPNHKLSKIKPSRKIKIELSQKSSQVEKSDPIELIIEPSRKNPIQSSQKSSQVEKSNLFESKIEPSQKNVQIQNPGYTTSLFSYHTNSAVPFSSTESS